MALKIIGFTGLALLGLFGLLVLFGITRGTLRVVQRARLFICAPPLAQLDQVRTILEKAAAGHVAHQEAIAALETESASLKGQNLVVWTGLGTIENRLNELHAQGEQIRADMNILGEYTLLMDQRLTALEARGITAH